MRAAPPIDLIVQTIVDHVHPRRVILFGSHARGDARDDSDVDLMVEMETALSRHDRRQSIDALFPRRHWGMDILVYTPEEVAARRDDPGTMVFAIEREGRVLYRRPEVAAPPPAAHPEIRERPRAPASVQWWIQYADADVQVIEVLLASESASWNHARFLAQQAAEKYLKVLLIARWTRPDRTHDLVKILAACRQAGIPLPGIDDDCRLLAAYAVEPRYPDDFFAPPRSVTEHDAREAVAAMRRVVAAAREALAH